MWPALSGWRSVSGDVGVAGVAWGCGGSEEHLLGGEVVDWAVVAAGTVGTVVVVVFGGGGAHCVEVGGGFGDRCAI